ncbi:MAG: hypothetical protein U5Q44_01095 [Dehalococcoidia bacterium]|nr:hypothetical protein [Dehalococcoidia bacterium]
MSETLLYDGHTIELAGATCEDGELWVDPAELATATGWTLEPEGMCHGSRCVPLPPGREDDLVREGRVNFTAFARHLGAPVVTSESAGAWAIGAEPQGILAGTQAHRLRAPHLQGNTYRLSDFRGRKVFLASWASW